MKILILITAIIATAGLVVGVVALVVDKPKSDALLQARIRALESQLSGVRQELVGLENRRQTNASAITVLQTCLPHLQQEIENVSHGAPTLIETTTKPCKALLLGTG